MNALLANAVCCYLTGSVLLAGAGVNIAFKPFVLYLSDILFLGHQSTPAHKRPLKGTVVFRDAHACHFFLHVPVNTSQGLSQSTTDKLGHYHMQMREALALVVMSYCL